MASSTQLQLNPERYRKIAAPFHTALVLLIVAAWAYNGKIASDQLRTVANVNRLVLYMRTSVMEWLVFAVVILGVRLNGSPLRAVIGERWQSVTQVLRDVAIAAGFWMISVPLLSTFDSYLRGPAASKNIQFLLPQGAVEMAAWVVLSVTAGICEEAIHRGYLQQQF